MRVVLATRAFAKPGGSETYLLTVAEALERLGHQATIQAQQLGDMKTLARSRGTRVERSLAASEPCDAALAQDGAAAYELAGRYPGVPILFVAHSPDWPLQTPPQLAGACDAVVAMNDRVVERLRALARVPRILRLRQPVDLPRFRTLGRTEPANREAVAFPTYLGPTKTAAVKRGCREAGFTLRLIAGPGAAATLHPEREMSRAAVVIGSGRCAVEGMAMGKAVYVCGLAGADGWVSRDSYGAIESDGFAGMATDFEFGADRLARDLLDLRPEMGSANRDLAHAHHDALDHARELVQAWRSLGARDAAPTETEEMARLIRLQHQTEEKAITFAMESYMWKERAEESRRWVEGVRASRRFRLGSALLAPGIAVRRLWRRLRRRETRGRSRSPRSTPHSDGAHEPAVERDHGTGQVGGAVGAKERD